MMRHPVEVKVSPLRPEDFETGVRAHATDMASGTSQELTPRRGSNCQFFERFPARAYDVALGLDWNDLDSEGNPTLDADFYRRGTDIMDKSSWAFAPFACSTSSFSQIPTQPSSGSRVSGLRE
jgi:hypothetical protein